MEYLASGVWNNCNLRYMNLGFSYVRSKWEPRCVYLWRAIRLIQGKVNTIQTVRQRITRQPHGVLLAVPSLSRYFTKRNSPDKVHLKPLVVVAMPCRPATANPTTLSKIQPSIPCCVCRVVFSRSSDLGVKYEATLHTQGSAVCSLKHKGTKKVLENSGYRLSEGWITLSTG